MSDHLPPIDGYDGFRMRKHATTGGRFLAPAILAAFEARLNICGSQGTDSDAAMSAFALRSLEADAGFVTLASSEVRRGEME